MCTLIVVSRRYELKQRAALQQETRQRIVEAAVELHRTIGPARTTVSAIAQLAGVERKTFYRHFPDSERIFEACSAHYRALNPPPDPHRWLAIQDPRERLRHGLFEAYAYYRHNQQMMGNALRDRELGLPVGDGFLRHRAAAKEALSTGFGSTARRRRRLNAALDLALDFHAWQTLANSGLDDSQAVKLMTTLIDATLS